MELRNTKKRGVRAEENQENRNKCGRKPRKAGLERRKTKKGGLERRKTKKSGDSAEENKEKLG